MSINLILWKMQFSDQLTPGSPTENAIFGIINPGRLKTSCVKNDLQVRNADAYSFKS